MRLSRHKHMAPALLALGLGIGSATAIFSVVNAVFLRPLPYPEADRIVVPETVSPRGEAVWIGSPAKFNFLRAHTVTLQDLSAYRLGRVNLTGVDYPEQIRAAYVTEDYFRLFGQSVAPGRPFDAEECRPGGRRVVVLGRKFWERVFGGDPRIVGRSIALDEKPHEVIGILVSAAEFPARLGASEQQPPDVWMPMVFDPRSTDQNGYFSAAARLKPGVTLTASRAEMRLVANAFQREFPGGLDDQSVFTLQSMREALIGGTGSSLTIFGWAAGLLLLISCANVAGLLLIRSTARKREFAVRAAIGASRARIVRHLLGENLVLAGCGGVLGLGIGMAGIRLLLALNAVSLPRIGEHGSSVTVDWRVLAFAAAVSAMACILSGLAPALEATRVDLIESLKGGTSRGAGSGSGGRARALLVFAEVALALVLLTGAGLLIRTWITLHAIDPGLDPHRVLTMRLSLAGTRFQKSAAVSELVRESVARIGALPGVEAVASTCCLAMQDNLIGAVEIVGRPRKNGDPDVVDVATVSPQYFDVFRIPLKNGRGFTDRDVSGSPPVVIINQAMARRFWPGDPTFEKALGAELHFPDIPQQTWRVAGIAGDVRAYGVSQVAPSIVYFPVAQAPEDLSAYIVRNPVAWTIRVRQESNSLRLAIQKELSQASGGLAVSSVASMDTILSRALAGRQFNMWLLAAFGSSALLLASLGIYGSVAWSVEQRTHEIGVRMALGADARTVRTLVLWQGMRVALGGVAIGGIAAVVLGRFSASTWFGAKGHDPLALALAGLVLLTVAFFATWLPARRASLVAPVQALRHE